MLDNVDIRFGQFTHFNFRDAELINCTMIDAILVGADFTGAKIINCTLDGAILSGAKLFGADLSGTKLSLAKFTVKPENRPDLSTSYGAAAISQAALCDSDTKWPSGFNRVSAGVELIKKK